MHGPGFPTARLLVVDDDPDVLAGVSRAWSREDPDVVVDTAASGEEALQLLEVHDYDVIIADERMRGLTGTRLLARVSRTRPDAVRVLMTAYREADVASAGLSEAHVHGFIWKPVSLREVLDRTRQLMWAHRTALAGGNA